MEPILKSIEPNACSGKVEGHEGEECALILQGTLEVWLGEKVFVLEKGDSIFQIELMLKDLSLVSAMAHENDIPLQIGDSAAQLYRLAKRRGYGKKDVAGILLAMEEVLNIKFPRKENE